MTTHRQRPAPPSFGTLTLPSHLSTLIDGMVRSLLQTFRNDDPQLYVHEEDVLSFARLPGTEIWTIEDCRDFLLKVCV